MFTETHYYMTYAFCNKSLDRYARLLSSLLDAARNEVASKSAGSKSNLNFRSECLLIISPNREPTSFHFIPLLYIKSIPIKNQPNKCHIYVRILIQEMRSQASIFRRGQSFRVTWAVRLGYVNRLRRPKRKPYRNWANSGAHSVPLQFKVFRRHLHFGARAEMGKLQDYQLRIERFCSCWR